MQQVATYSCSDEFELIGEAVAICTAIDGDSAEFQPNNQSCEGDW